MQKDIKDLNFSFWALPANPRRAYYEKKIKGFARKYNSFAFKPHVTLYAGRCRKETALNMLKRLKKQNAFILTPLMIKSSNKLAKTFFIEYKNNNKAIRLNKIIRSDLGDSQKYIFSAHLSLLYKNFSKRRNVCLIKKEPVQLYPICIDKICLVHTPMPFSNIQDIPNWRILDCIKLKSIQ